METKASEFQAAKILFPLVLTACFFASSCSVVKSESEVLGEYELRVENGKIVLSILPDKSFSETIYLPNRQTVHRSGKWLWAEGGISFDELWIPPEFAPDYILQADSSATAQGQPKYTEPGHWSIRAEKHWGRVTLPIFPDANVDFKMIKRFNA